MEWQSEIERLGSVELNTRRSASSTVALRLSKDPSGVQYEEALVHVTTLLTSDRWETRHGGLLTCIAICTLNSSSKSTNILLSKIVAAWLKAMYPMCLNLLEDPETRVRLATGHSTLLCSLFHPYS